MINSLYIITYQIFTRKIEMNYPDAAVWLSFHGLSGFGRRQSQRGQSSQSLSQSHHSIPCNIPSWQLKLFLLLLLLLSPFFLPSSSSFNSVLFLIPSADAAPANLQFLFLYPSGAKSLFSYFGSLLPLSPFCLPPWTSLPAYLPARFIIYYPWRHGDWQKRKKGFSGLVVEPVFLVGCKVWYNIT